MPKGKGTKRMSKKVSKKMVGGQIVPMGGMGVNQGGSYFWEQKDPIFGGFNRFVGKLFEGVKPSEVAKFVGKAIPLADTVGNLLGQAGLGAKPRRRRTQRGRGADSYHTSASMMPTTSPNTSNFGSVKF